jgi:hypothetical protein
MVDERINKVLRRFPSWWKTDSDSNTYGLMDSFVYEFDSFATEMDNMKLELYVETATGTYLDELGKLFKLGRRSGETDAQFRARIKAYWPGFSGGGTEDAIKSTVNKITGVPVTNITVTDIPDSLKFEVDVVITDIATLALIPTIYDTIWAIKAAGCYPFIWWVINGSLLEDTLEVTDAVSITVVPTTGAFRWELSLIEGPAVLS